MTAILEQIRQLEAARDRGAMTPTEFERAKERLFETVEDAVTTAAPVRPQRAAKDRPGNGVFWPALFFSVLGVLAITGLATALLGDLTLALTIAVTLLAAITVKAFRTLDE